MIRIVNIAGICRGSSKLREYGEIPVGQIGVKGDLVELSPSGLTIYHKNISTLKNISDYLSSSKTLTRQ